MFKNKKKKPTTVSRTRSVSGTQKVSLMPADFWDETHTKEMVKDLISLVEPWGWGWQHGGVS